MLLVGCKSDLRTDVSTLVELSNHRQTPVSYDQVCMLSGANVAFKKNDGSRKSLRIKVAAFLKALLVVSTRLKALEENEEGAPRVEMVTSGNTEERAGGVVPVPSRRASQPLVTARSS